MLILIITVGELRSKVTRLVPAFNSKVEIQITDNETGKRVNVDAHRERLGFRTVYSVSTLDSKGDDAVLKFDCGSFSKWFSFRYLTGGVESFFLESRNPSDPIPNIVRLDEDKNSLSVAFDLLTSSL